MDKEKKKGGALYNNFRHRERLLEKKIIFLWRLDTYCSFQEGGNVYTTARETRPKES